LWLKWGSKALMIGGMTHLVWCQFPPLSTDCPLQDNLSVLKAGRHTALPCSNQNHCGATKTTTFRHPSANAQKCTPPHERAAQLILLISHHTHGRKYDGPMCPHQIAWLHWFHYFAVHERAARPLAGPLPAARGAACLTCAAPPPQPGAEQARAREEALAAPPHAPSAGARCQR